MRLRVGLLVVLAFGGCGGIEEPISAEPGDMVATRARDAGAPRVESVDGGSALGDAGSSDVPDAGNSAADAGASNLDSGVDTADADADAGPLDAGGAPVDAGPGPSDAGPAAMLAAPTLSIVRERDTLRLTWSAIPGATHYALERSMAAGGARTLVAMPSALTAVDPAQTSGQTYFFTVRALSATGSSGDSNSVSGSVTRATATYQQGAQGYAGSEAVGISTYSGLGAPGTWNGNGTTFADGLNDWCMGTDIPSTPLYSEVMLLRFGALGLPVGASVLSASLTLWAHGDDAHTNLALDGRYLAAPWNPTTNPVNCAGCAGPVGWRYRDGSTAPWGGLGASLEGTDFISGKSFRLPETGAIPTGSQLTALTTSLDVAIVQGWLTGPNYGVRIVTATPQEHVGYVPPQRNNQAAQKPRLVITYAY